MSTNIDYWEKVLENPTPAFEALFDAELTYIRSRVPGNSKVLEIGCGNGRNIKSIAEFTKDIIGIDNDPKAVEDARKNLAGFSGVKIMLADALDLPFPDKSFDVMIFLDTLVNMKENKVQALKEMSRVLTDTGKIIISVYSEDAFDARMDIYKIVNAPINKTEGTKVTFDESLAANVSEQFSKEDIESLADQSGLNLVDCKKVPGIAYICTLAKK